MGHARVLNCCTRGMKPRLEQPMGMCLSASQATLRLKPAFVDSVQYSPRLTCVFDTSRFRRHPGDPPRAGLLIMGLDAQLRCTLDTRSAATAGTGAAAWVTGKLAGLTEDEVPECVVPYEHTVRSLSWNTVSLMHLTHPLEW